MHELAVDELVAAAREIRASKRLSRVEVNYLVAYAVQYWECSAQEIGLHQVTKEVADALKVQSPIELSRVPMHLRRKFPLSAKFDGVEIVH